MQASLVIQHEYPMDFGIQHLLRHLLERGITTQVRISRPEAFDGKNR